MEIGRVCEHTGDAASSSYGRERIELVWQDNIAKASEAALPFLGPSVEAAEVCQHSRNLFRHEYRSLL